MEQHLEKRESVEVVGGEPVVLEEDVKATKGYFQRRRYAFVGKDNVYEVKEEMTLRQVLQLQDHIKEEVQLYVFDGPVRTKKKREQVKETAPKRRSRAKRVQEAPKEEGS